MEQWLSRHVVYEGRDLGLSIVARDDDGRVEVRPFEREEAAVAFVPCTIRVETAGDCTNITFDDEN